MVLHFRKRKSCCRVIAISPAGIAAQTLTQMQSFKQKKGHIEQLHSHNHMYEELVVQNLCRELHSSVTVRHFRKRKSCHHVIAIPQAGIAAPTLTGMQGFEAKKDSSVHFLRRSCIPRLYSVFFHSTHVLRDSSLTAIQTHARLLRGARPYHSITLAATISCKIAVFKPNV